MTNDSHEVEEVRPMRDAVLNGLRQKCPKCGTGKLFDRYLKVSDVCDSCHQPLHHHRADDLPAYLTILVVGHIIGLAVHLAWTYWQPEALTLAAVMSVLAIASCLVLLPRMKGLVVAFQWAKQMHGF